jgi:hypothetical protein
MCSWLPLFVQWHLSMTSGGLQYCLLLILPHQVISPCSQRHWADSQRRAVKGLGSGGTWGVYHTEEGSKGEEEGGIWTQVGRCCPLWNFGHLYFYSFSFMLGRFELLLFTTCVSGASNRHNRF